MENQKKSYVKPSINSNKLRITDVILASNDDKFEKDFFDDEDIFGF